MSVIVSCLSEGLLLVDGGRVETLDGLPTAGLAIGSRLIARARHDPAETALDGDVLLYGAAGLERTMRIDGLADAHDVAWDGGLLACVSTLRNAVLRVRDGRVVERKALPGEGDCHHLSGLVRHRGRLLVTSFGCFRGHRDWAEAPRDGAGLLVDVDSGVTVLDGLHSPHTPRLLGDGLALCDSGRSALLVLDCNYRPRRRVLLRGWTRGIAATSRAVYVGESARRGEPGTASLAVLRRRDLALVARLPLPVREVYDLAVLSPARARELATPYRPPVPMAALRLADLRAEVTAPVGLALRPGALADVHCTVTNRARVPLATAPPHPVSVAATWTPAGRALWSPLPGRLEPGEQTRCRVRVLAPARPGRYRLELGVVQEGVSTLAGSASVEATVG